MASSGSAHQIRTGREKQLFFEVPMSKINDATNAGERKIEMNEQVRELTKDELNSVSGGKVYRITNVRANATTLH
jgi:bacteriocin-like protein